MENGLNIKLDTVITVSNGGMRWVVYRDEKSGHLVFGKFDELNMDEMHKALQIIQSDGHKDFGI